MASTRSGAGRSRDASPGTPSRSLPGAAAALERLRRICLALPEATERPSHGAPCFFIRDKKTFAMFWDNHHGDGILAAWVAAPPGAQETLIAAEPERFYYPPYVGYRGWVGVRLDGKPDWKHVAAVIEDGYRSVAPAKLLALLDR